MKRSQAERAIQEGACVWVEYGISVRSATLAESIAFRNQLAAERDPIPSAELPGLIYQPPATDHNTDRYSLIQQANQLICAQAI